jgi:hypothetical protein
VLINGVPSVFDGWALLIEDRRIARVLRLQCEIATP